MATPTLRPGPTQQADTANTATSAETSEYLVDVGWLHRRADRRCEHQTRLVPLRTRCHALGDLALAVPAESVNAWHRHGDKPRRPIRLHRPKSQRSPGSLQRLTYPEHAAIKINIRPRQAQRLAAADTEQ